MVFQWKTPQLCHIYTQREKEVTLPVKTSMPTMDSFLYYDVRNLTNLLPHIMGNENNQ